MPRNVSGTYSLPAGNPVVTQTTIASSWANTTLDDLKTEVTDSLSRSAKGGMLGALALVDGTAALPALAFNTELTTGAYRPAANQLGLSVAGAQQLLLETVAPALKATSYLAAADVGADFLVTTTNARTAGSLLVVTNAGGSRLRVDSAGAIALANSGTISASDTTNLSLTLAGNKNAADAGVDVVITSLNTRTAGDLVGIKNNGVLKTRLAFDGSLQFLDNAQVSAGGTNSSLFLKGNRAAADAGTDVVLDGQATRTAGNLLEVRNNGAARILVTPAGDLTFTGQAAYTTVKQATSGLGLILMGNLTAAAGGGEIALSSAVTRTAGFIVDIQNNFTSEARFTFDGALHLANNTSVLAVATNTALTLKGNRAAADTGADVVLTGQATRTAGNLLDIQNNGSTRARVTFAGDVQFTSSGTVTNLAQLTANSEMRLTGNKSAADTGTDVVLNSTATRTAGKLLDVLNNGTSKFSVDFAGNVSGLGIVQAWAFLTLGASGAVTVTAGRGVSSASYSLNTLTVNLSPNAPGGSAYSAVATFGNTAPNTVAYVQASTTLAASISLTQLTTGGAAVNWANGQIVHVVAVW